MAQTQPAIQIFNRQRGVVEEETVLGDRLLRLAYLSPARPLFRLLFCRTALFSRLLGWYCDSRFSRRKIRATIQRLGINMEECAAADGSFSSFNDFFTRKLRPEARPFSHDPAILCSPADSRLLVFPELQNETLPPVKGAAFKIGDFLRPPAGFNLPDFHGGAALIARLCPADYHRYHYPAAGRTLGAWEISGRLDSVNPMALGLGLPVFTENRRRVAILELENFGTMAFVEVGAFGVGGIVQTHDETMPFSRLDEKGLFQFGASTLVLIFRPKTVHFDQDLARHSATGMETLVRVGEKIGIFTSL